MHDLAVIVVSYATNNEEWLVPCLRTLYEHAGDLDLDVVVADNESTDGTAELIQERFPAARVVRCRNRGFGHANNRALLTCDARYVLFLNPDTEVLEGSLAELVELLDRRPEVGLAGVRQVTPDGELYPTIRRFPNAIRALGEALGSERLPHSFEWLGERVRDPEAYDRETPCDWMTGSFLLVRAEALLSAGAFDERMFMSSEETDLAYRVKQAGWSVVHLPTMTILHHVHMGAPLGERMEAQSAFARAQYASKHLSPLHRAVYLACVRARYRLRHSLAAAGRTDPYWRAASRRALRVLRGSDPPPFGEPPPTALAAGSAAAYPRAHASENGGESSLSATGESADR